MPELSLKVLTNLMFMGTFDGSVPPYEETPRKEEQSDEEYEKIRQLERELAIGAAREYHGSYVREKIELALQDLIKENKPNWNVFFHYVRHAYKYAKPIIIEIGGKKEEVYIRWREVNGIVRALERFDNIITRDFLHGTVYWVCQKQPDDSYYSCLVMPYSPAPRWGQIYFLDEGMARKYMEIFARNKHCSRGEPVYLHEVIATGKGDFEYREIGRIQA